MFDDEVYYLHGCKSYFIVTFGCVQRGHLDVGLDSHVDFVDCLVWYLKGVGL